MPDVDQPVPGPPDTGLPKGLDELKARLQVLQDRHQHGPVESASATVVAQLQTARRTLDELLRYGDGTPEQRQIWRVVFDQLHQCQQWMGRAHALPWEK